MLSPSEFPTSISSAAGALEHTTSPGSEALLVPGSVLMGLVPATSILGTLAAVADVCQVPFQLLPK